MLDDLRIAEEVGVHVSATTRTEMYRRSTSIFRSIRQFHHIPAVCHHIHLTGISHVKRPTAHTGIIVSIAFAISALYHFGILGSCIGSTLRGSNMIPSTK